MSLLNIRLAQRLATLSLVLSGALFGPSALAGDELVTQDADVRASTPNTRHGGRNTLSVRDALLHQTLLDFDLSGYSGPILSATLTLPIKNVFRAGRLEVRSLLSAWDEASVNFSNRPVISSQVGGNLTVANSDANRTVSVDVTALVQSLIDQPSTNFGIALVPDGSIFIHMSSGETPNGPVLTIDTAGPPPVDPVLIESVFLVEGILSINGQNFDNGTTPAVSLSGIGQLTVDNASETNIMASVESGEGELPEGDYLLTVSTGPDAGQTATFDLTVGAVGNQGPPGPQGPAGPEGPQGPQGIAGPAGPAGETGAVGPVGSAGETGDVGPMGPAGETGAIGPAGAAGEPGAVGPMGPAGAVGAIGPVGATGETGPAGPMGPAGAVGAVGPVGATGETGPAGPIGPTGAAGAIGPAGAAGETGPIGPAGPSGETGATGSMGPMGLPGAPGVAGPAGPAGEDGTDGVNGVNGVSGAVGPAGPEGPAGPVGPPGGSGGIIGYQVVTDTFPGDGANSSSLPRSNGAVRTTLCPTGKIVIGGGARVIALTALPPLRPTGGMGLWLSQPNATRTGWEASVVNTTEDFRRYIIEVTAICIAEPTPGT